MLHLKRGFTYFLCFNIIITSFPGWVFAALIQSHDESTTVLKARNQKTQLIYIATPNENGLSHNRYNRFDVDQNGAVFINFNDGKGEARRSDLAASVIGNPALLNGGSASLILNEVVSGKTSNIAGFLEVVGNKAGVIIANPYGVTCNGCGFINTSRATLTTGIPKFNEGNLSFDINKGNINIDSNGLNAKTVDVLDIIAKGVSINGVINAKNMLIVGGKSKFSYLARLSSGVDEGDNDNDPRYAIDASVVGGMYANRIHLISHGKNVGVKVDSNMATSTDDIVFTAEGDIEIAGVLNSRKDIVITSDQSINIYTPEPVKEEAATEANSNSESSPETNSNSESNSNSNSDLDSDSNSDSKSDSNSNPNNHFYANNIDINAGKKVEISVQSMGAKNNLNITANDFISDTAQQGGVRFAKNININVINGTYEALNMVQYIAKENIDIKATSVSIQGADSDNRVKLNVNEGKLSISSQSVDIDNAFLGTKKNIQITAPDDLQIGKDVKLSSQEENITINAGQLTSEGMLFANKDITIEATKVTNSGNMFATNQLAINATEFDNQKNIFADEAVLSIGKILTNAKGAQILVDSRLVINTLADGILAVINAGLLALKSSLNITSTNGTTQSTPSTGSLTISADTFDNSGNLSANEIILNVDSKLINQAGANILADKQLTIKQTANVVANKVLTVINAGLLALRSSLNTTSTDGTTQSTPSTGSLTIFADILDNGGNISANEITLNIDDTLNNKENAQISADSQVIIKQTNTSGNKNEWMPSAMSALELPSTPVIISSATSNNLVVNNKGLLLSSNVLNISANILSNEKDIAAKEVTLTIDKTLDNTENAKILVNNQLTIKQTKGTNNNLVVSNKGLLLSKDRLNISANTLDNQKDISAKKATLEIKTALDNKEGARIFIDDTLDITADNINNTTNSKILAVDSTFTVDTFVNNGSVKSMHDLTIQKKTQDNKIATLNIKSQYAFYAGNNFNIVKNATGIFNVNIVDGFIAKGINWAINKLDLRGTLKSSAGFHLDVVDTLTLGTRSSPILESNPPKEGFIPIPTSESKYDTKEGFIPIPTSESKYDTKEGKIGQKAMILLTGSEVNNSIKVDKNLVISEHSAISSLGNLTLKATLISIAVNAAITGFKHLGISGNIDNKGFIYSDETLDLVAPNYIHNTGKGCVASNGCISAQTQLRMAHSEGALTLPSNVGSIVGEMELINQGDIESENILIVAKKVVNTIPSDSNFGKKDKMVLVSQTIADQYFTKSTSYTKIVEVFHEEYLDGFNPNNNRPSISATRNLSILGFKEVQNTGGTLSATDTLNLTSHVDGSRIINQSVSLFKVTKTTEHRTEKVCSIGEVWGDCVTEITCSAIAWGLLCFLTPKAKVKVTITVNEDREKLKKGSIKAGLFAKDIEIKADSLYTGEINDVLSDQELSKKTQDIEQDIPEAPEDGELEIESAEVTKSDNTIKEKEVEADREATEIEDEPEIEYTPRHHMTHPQ